MQFGANRLISSHRLGHKVHVLLILLIAAPCLFEMLFGERRNGWPTSTTLVKHGARVVIVGVTALAIDRMGCCLGWRLLRVALVVEDRVLIGGCGYARVSVVDVKIQIFTLQHFWRRRPELIAYN